MSDEDKEIPMPKAEEPAVEEVTLTIQDISYCKSIIEIANSKGAFKAEELAVVGTTYNRITKWLLQNAPADTTETKAEETSEAEGEKDD